MLHHFEFEYPSAFILILLILCIYKCPYIIRTLFFPHLHFFTRFKTFLDKEKLLYSLIFTLLVTSLASPISYDAKTSNNRKGRDLVFALDTSGSMGESGYSQNERSKSKFDTLKELIGSFISHRFDDNVGVSVFGSFAFASIPLTYDMKSVAFLLDFLEVGIAGENTAIGDGIMQAIRVLKQGDAKTKVIILVTDGYQNSGNVSIKKALIEAKKLNIKIYTIGIGKKNSYDTLLLEKIATDSGGKNFQAKSAKELEDVYEALNALEKSPIRSQNYLNKELLFTYPLSVAIFLLIFLLIKKREL